MIKVRDFDFNERMEDVKVEWVNGGYEVFSQVM